MRVTQSGMWSMIRRNLADTAARTRDVEEQAVGGMLVNRPSDAPDLLVEIDRLHASGMDQDVYKKTSAQSLAQLDQMDSELGRVHDALSRARELAVQMAGDLPTSDQRGYAAEEVEAIKATVLSAANADFAGRYLFSGTAWDTAPFDSTGVYQGSTDEPTTRVGDDTWVTTARDGSSVFQGSVDIFARLDAFITALNADDSAGISTAIGDLDGMMDQVMDARARVGTDTNVADDAATLADSLSSQIESRMGELVSADPAETYTKLSELRSSYQTALQVAASAKSQGLFDLL